MPESIYKFVMETESGALETTLSRLGECMELRNLPSLLVPSKLVELLDPYGVEISPSIEIGHLDTNRILRRKALPSRFESALDDALSKDEGLFIEYKESIFLRKNIDYERVPKDKHCSYDLVNEVIKTLCAFMNAGGGTLLVGVDDNGSIIGIECEFAYLPGRNKNLDGWQLFFYDCFKTCVESDSEFFNYFQCDFVERNDKTVAVFLVKACKTRLAICRAHPKSESRPLECVFVRGTGNSIALDIRGIETLVLERHTVE